MISLSTLMAGVILVCACNPVPDVPVKEIEVRAQAFLDAVLKRDFAGAGKDFDETMTRVLPPEKIESTWKETVDQVGAFKKQTDKRTEKRTKHEIVYLTCVFEKATLDVKLVFDADKRIAGWFFVAPKSKVEYRAPAYAKPEQFRESQVTVGTGEWALPGTLTLPVGDGPFPAVVLVHGSGPNDRDETIGPNKPFRDLAEGLASRGIAVLRYEKRTREHQTKMAELRDTITLREEVVDDAQAAVALLRKAERIDQGRIFVLGHSLGAMLAPRIGAAEPTLAGMIAMAGAARPWDDVILDQVTYILTLERTDNPNKAELEKLKAQVLRVKDTKVSPETPRSELPLGVSAAYLLALRDLHPAQEAAELTMRILILHGERDYQVTTADFDLWQKSLAGHKNAALKSYPDLNHLFMEGKGKATPAEYAKVGHVAQNVVDDIVEWIKKR